MAHIGFTPQSEHTLGGYRVQGRGDAADRVLRDAHAVQEAGAFAVVMEMVPGDVAAQVTKELTIPTIGIGAGNELRRPGAGLAGRLRPAHGPDGHASSSSTPTSTRCSSTPPGRTPTTCKAGTFPGPEHTF